MTQLELINNWLELYEKDEVTLTPEGLMEKFEKEVKINMANSFVIRYPITVEDVAYA
jgi:hypothetical protein